MKYGQEIVINRMYNGDYLNENLGHEIINMYKDDNGNKYIYLQPLGTFAYEHTNKIGCILLARTIPGKKKLEILGKADYLEDVYKYGHTAKEQIEYINKHNIKYGGVLLNKIFESNKKNQDIFISFKAKEVLKPIRTTYLSFEKNTECDIILKENKQAKASLKQYFDSSTPEDYDTLFNFINDNNNWEKEIDKVTPDRISIPSEKNFFEICGIENYELAFSNALAYFMKRYPELITKFAKEYLDKDYIPAEDFDIIREKEKNIDLLVTDKNYVIVIENKIKSEINGHIKTSQNNDLEYSQLSKYYNHAKKISNGRKIRCFLLTPNYNDIDLKCYADGEQYTKIYYSQIYQFLHKQQINDIYLNEYIKAIHKHTKEYNNELYEEMKLLFYNIIKSKK